MYGSPVQDYNTNTHLYTKHSVNDHNYAAKVNDAGRELLILGKL